jgi:hypothetical protein
LNTAVRRRDPLPATVGQTQQPSASLREERRRLEPLLSALPFLSLYISLSLKS